jgi:hypothetical protein
MTRTDPVPPPEQPTPGDLDAAGIANLRKVFPRAIAKIEAEARAAEHRAVVRPLHDAFCRFAGGGMCYRLECSTLDAIRAALDAVATDTPEEPCGYFDAIDSRACQLPKGHYPETPHD